MNHPTNKTSKHKSTAHFKHTIKDMQNDLPLASKMFSKIIHIKFIETASDIISSTLARPTAILFGGISAFVCVGVLYVIARYTGFALSGSETLIAFAVGWLIGICTDIIVAILRKYKHY